jgi:integrase/recombinase XerD
MLISCARIHLSIKLQLSFETGMRPVEIYLLKPRDLDPEKGLIITTPVKHGNGRTLKISTGLTAKLKAYIEQNHIQPNDRLFKGNPRQYGNHYREMRNRLAIKTGDPTIRTIRLYDFRHYFATMLYDKTRDIMLVRQRMGHKRIDTTLIYTQLIHFNEEEEYTVKTATNLQQATELLEHGFTYIQEIDGIRLYRKRK